MTNDNQILTLEEGITGSIPSVAISHGLHKRLVDLGKYSREERGNLHDKIMSDMIFKFLTTNPRYYEVSRPDRRNFLISQGAKDDYSTGFSPSLKVNLDEYIKTYQKLLENPSKIYNFIELLNPEIKDLFVEGVLPEGRSKESNLINHLFGISDHSQLKAVCNKNDLLKVSNYIMDKIITPLFNLGEEDGFNTVAHLKGAPKYERDIGGIKVNGYYNQGHLRLHNIYPFLKNMPDNVIQFGSDFDLPVDDSVRGINAFNGLTRMLDALKECPEVKGIDLDIGIRPCILPTWQRE